MGSPVWQTRTVGKAEPSEGKEQEKLLTEAEENGKCQLKDSQRQALAGSGGAGDTDDSVT